MRSNLFVARASHYTPSPISGVNEFREKQHRPIILCGLTDGNAFHTHAHRHTNTSHFRFGLTQTVSAKPVVDLHAHHLRANLSLMFISFCVGSWKKRENNVIQPKLSCCSLISRGSYINQKQPHWPRAIWLTNATRLCVLVIYHVVHGEHNNYKYIGLTEVLDRSNRQTRVVTL